MSVPLLDVNALVALAWSHHEHHEVVADWFESHHRDGWATCSVSQSGFVRVSSNPKIIPYARTPVEVIALLRELTSLPGHEFWSDEISLADSEFVRDARLQGYRQVTDLHLLALAAQKGGTLLTLDGKIHNLIPHLRRGLILNLLSP